MKRDELSVWHLAATAVWEPHDFAYEVWKNLNFWPATTCYTPAGESCNWTNYGSHLFELFMINEYIFCFTVFIYYFFEGAPVRGLQLSLFCFNTCYLLGWKIKRDSSCCCYTVVGNKSTWCFIFQSLKSVYKYTVNSTSSLPIPLYLQFAQVLCFQNGDGDFLFSSGGDHNEIFLFHFSLLASIVSSIHSLSTHSSCGYSISNRGEKSLYFCISFTQYSFKYKITDSCTFTLYSFCLGAWL